MEEDDEIQSPSSPTPNGRITVTVASAPPSNSLTLALPIQPQKTPGREDCWTEAATAVLIDAWGERYLELSRGNLKQKHWKDVADIVCSREDYAKTPKTDIQCKNRIDTVKKKYKTEKAKIASGGGPSKWRFFHKLDELIGPTPSKSNSAPPPPMDLYQRGVPMGIPVGIRSSSSVQKPLLKRPSFESEDESEPENSADSSDGLPPDTYNNKRGKIQKMEMPTAMNNANGSCSQRRDGGGMRGNGRKNKEESNWANSMKELTRAVLKFGEAYEQAETAKLQQLVEMEKQRMKFAKELELQRMQYFMKTQMELSQLKNRSSANTNNHHHHHHRRVISNKNDNNKGANNTNNNNNTKNSDSSN